jgi:isopropylmalate/homocitrate/citramalate synthase
MRAHDLIFDWNRETDGVEAEPPGRVELNDETLRDGLQSPSATNPAVSEKIRLLHLMAKLGISAANLGNPSANPRIAADVKTLAREIATAHLPIQPSCAARTVRADIEPIVEISQHTGTEIEVGAFIGSSTIRQYVEGWELSQMLRFTEDAITFAVKEGLRVIYITEDTTRADPDVLKALYSTAIDCGASRICLADTVGHATPQGVRRLVRFVRREILGPTREQVKIDWHGHRDRGLAIANSLAAIEEGVARIDATALGVGERCGNTEMDVLLVNLVLLGLHNGDLTPLWDYVRLASVALNVPIAYNWPIFGSDAFRTGTGVHAAALIKAHAKGDAWLADRVYSSVPAGMVGLSQRIEISPMSGVSNVRYWLAKHGYDASNDRACERILAFAKSRDGVVTDDEVLKYCGTLVRPYHGLPDSPAT